MDKVRFMSYTTGMKNTTRILAKAILMSCASLLLANCAGQNVKQDVKQEPAISPRELPPKVKGAMMLFRAVDAQDLEILEGVLSQTHSDLFIGPYEVDINMPDSDGRTALMHAAAHGNIAIIKRLLRAKADVGLRDSEGKTAVIHAHFREKPEAVKLLSKVGKREYSYWTVTPPKSAEADNQYTGRLYFDKPDGQGVLKTKVFSYEGEFKMSKYHGKGTFVSAQGSYTGEFQDGNFHGKGAETFTDGSRYEGTFKNGKRHGPIRITTRDGRTVVVEFVNGKIKKK